MKLDSNFKLSEVIQVAILIVSVTIFVVTDRNQIAALADRQKSDHEVIENLSRGFAAITSWQSAQDVRMSSAEKEIERAREQTGYAPSTPHRTSSIQAIKEIGE